MFCIAICDHRSDERARTIKLIGQYQEKNPAADVLPSLFFSSQALLQAIEDGSRFDLYLLESTLPDLQSSPLLKTLYTIPERADIIFTAVPPELMIDAFPAEPAHFLAKPLNKADLHAALDDAIASLNIRSEIYTLIRTPQADRQVRVSNIVFVETAGHVLRYSLNTGDTLSSKVLRIPFEKAAAGLISDDRFIRPHRSYLVNAAHIAKFSPDEFTMDNGAKIPISRLRLSEVKTTYMDYLAQARYK